MFKSGYLKNFLLLIVTAFLIQGCNSASNEDSSIREIRQKYFEMENCVFSTMQEKKYLYDAKYPNDELSEWDKNGFEKLVDGLTVWAESQCAYLLD